MRRPPSSGRDDGGAVLGNRRSPKRSAVALLLDLGSLAAQLAQVVQLRAADVATGHQLDAVQVRGVHRERPLDADAETDLADREGFPNATTLTADDVPGEDLDPGAGALDDLDVHLDGVARPEIRKIGPQRSGVQSVQGVHVGYLTRKATLKKTDVSHGRSRRVHGGPT